MTIMTETQYRMKEKINKLIDELVDNYIDWDLKKMENTLESFEITLKQKKSNEEDKNEM